MISLESLWFYLNEAVDAFWEGVCEEVSYKLDDY